MGLILGQVVARVRSHLVLEFDLVLLTFDNHSNVLQFNPRDVAFEIDENSFNFSTLYFQSLCSSETILYLQRVT